MIGDDSWQKKNGVVDPIHWEESRLANHLIGVTGTSGSGKTHWIRKFVSAMPSGVEIDVFDYHGDIDIPGAAEVLFSERTKFGYNPMVLNQDPDYGGVRRGVNDVINAINSTSRKLGTKQEAVLRNLLMDTYAARGIHPDEPRTWARKVVGLRDALEMRREGRAQDLYQTYPGLEDVLRLANRKLKALWLGIEDASEGDPVHDPETGITTVSDGKGRTALSQFEAACRALSAAKTAKAKANKAGSLVAGAEDIASIAVVTQLEEKAEAAKEKALAAYRVFLESVETNREFEEVVKYNSREVLVSVIGRLENLIATGLFSQNPPPFGDARVRRYNLRPVSQSEDELKMFVRFRLRSIIREEMQRGESGGRLRRLIVLDESKKFNDEDRSNPINVIATEMRKFGLALLQAGQSPSHFSEDFIGNAGTLLLLNMATNEWDDASRRLKVDKKKLEFLKARSTGLVRMTLNGESARFRQVNFRHD